MVKHQVIPSRTRMMGNWVMIGVKKVEKVRVNLQMIPFWIVQLALVSWLMTPWLERVGDCHNSC